VLKALSKSDDGQYWRSSLRPALFSRPPYGPSRGILLHSVNKRSIFLKHSGNRPAKTISYTEYKAPNRRSVHGRDKGTYLPVSFLPFQSTTRPQRTLFPFSLYRLMLYAVIMDDSQ